MFRLGSWRSTPERSPGSQGAGSRHREWSGLVVDNNPREAPAERMASEPMVTLTLRSRTCSRDAASGAAESPRDGESDGGQGNQQRRKNRQGQGGLDELAIVEEVSGSAGW